ncbi:MAG: hypothetical protein JXA09_08320 [Anaerolineae bacterium]|nr:hypothetical protein [Anaerolineae bacterium]
MKHASVRITLGVLLLVSSLATSAARAAGPGPEPFRVANLNATLEPGVLHSWVIGPSAACGGYIVEVTPKRPAADGAYVQTALVRPEFDGEAWHDVLRVGIPDGDRPLKANIRVYQTCEFVVAGEFEATLVAGEWMGWVIGPASMDRGFVVEVTPLEPSVEGAMVERAVVQEEYFMDEWQDVLRVQLAAGLPDLRAQFRIFAADGIPILAEYDVDLEPGVWKGIKLRPSTGLGGYIVEINPCATPVMGEFVERLAVQPEFDGKRWNDVLRMMTPIDQPPLSVQARVYGWGPPPQRP